jgi:hypothetical protein
LVISRAGTPAGAGQREEALHGRRIGREAERAQGPFGRGRGGEPVGDQGVVQIEQHDELVTGQKGSLSVRRHGHSR